MTTRMTKRQRVFASIRRRNPDAIPWQFDLTGAVADKIRSRLHVEDVGVALDDHMRFAWMPEPQVAEGTADEPVPPGCVRDCFGSVRRKEPADRSVGDWGGHVFYPLHEPSLEGYRFPDPLATPERSQQLARARLDHPDEFLWTGGGGLFERGWNLCGFENYLTYLAGEERFVREITEHLTDFYCKEVSLMKGTGLDAVRFGDDWGFQHGLMIPPQTWRRIYAKAYRRLFAAAHDAGLVAMLHSCGHVEPIIGDLIDAGLDVLHPLQPEANDVARCQREFGRRITFWGALGSQSTLPNGTVEDVRREVRERLAIFAGGGYILAPAGAAPTETPAENIIAIADEARAQLPA